MMSHTRRRPLLDAFYEQYLIDQDAQGFARHAVKKYSTGTLERLLDSGERMTRRAAAFGIGLLGDYESNAALGRALNDRDRGVRTLAENGIRALWCRQGPDGLRRKLGVVIRLNSLHRFEDAIKRASELVESAPWLGEAWNQRAIAQFSLRQFEESIRSCAQALEVNPYHFGAAAGMGQCFLQMGNRAGALESFRRALKLNPNLEGIRAQVQFLQRTLNKPE